LPVYSVFIALKCDGQFLLQKMQLKRVKGKGTVKPLMEVFHGTATECHLP